MDIEPTQALPLSDFEDDEADETTSGKHVVGRLKILSQKNYTEAVHEIFQGQNIVGRQLDKCSIALPDSKTLSKEHACIEVQGDTHLVYDLGSRNKTKRGKMYLSPNVRYELKEGDRLIFADMICVYHIGREGALVADSGSETGSESMLIADTQAVPGLKEDAADFLQPTQLYPSHGNSSVPRLVMDVPTQNFVDSFQYDALGSPAVPSFGQTKASVLETPAPNNNSKMKGSGDVSVVPESGDEGTPMSARNSSITQTLLYADSDEDETDDEQGEEAMRKMAAAVMATQPYGDRASDSEPDNDGPTQMFPALSSRGEDLIATQAYGEDKKEESAEDNDATQPFDDTIKTVGDESLSQAPTQTFSAEEVPNLMIGSTLAVQDSEEEQETQKIDKKPAKKVLWDDATQMISSSPPSGADAETQVLGLGDATQILGDKAEVRGMDSDEPTQMIDTDDPTQMIDKDAPTKVIDFDDPTQAVDDTDAPTQMLDFGGPTQAVDDTDAPTQMLDFGGPTQAVDDTDAPTQMLDGPTQAVDSDAPTQVIDSDDPTPAIDFDGPTQAVDLDGPTQKVAEDDPTQLIDTDAPTQAVDADAATQEMNLDATLPVDIPQKPRGRGRGRRGLGRGAQVDAPKRSPSPTPGTHVSPSRKKARFSDEPTQVIPDRSIEEVHQNLKLLKDKVTSPNKSVLKVPNAEDATQMISDDIEGSPVIPVFSSAIKKGATGAANVDRDMSDDATQPMEADATQPMDEDVTQTMAVDDVDAHHPVAAAAGDDDATQTMGDDETQPMDTDEAVPMDDQVQSKGDSKTGQPTTCDIEPTLAYGMEVEDDSPDPSTSATKDMEPTQGYGMDVDEESDCDAENKARDLEPTQGYEEEESPPLIDSAPLLDKKKTDTKPAAKKEEKPQPAKRGRKAAQKNAKTSAVTTQADTDQAESEEIIPTGRGARRRKKSPVPPPEVSAAKSGGRGRKKESAPVPEVKGPDAAETDPSKDLTTTRKRGRPRAAAEKETDEAKKIDEPLDERKEDAKPEGKKQPTRGRGRKSKAKQDAESERPDEPVQLAAEASTSAGNVNKKEENDAEKAQSSSTDVPKSDAPEGSQEVETSGRRSRGGKKSPVPPTEETAVKVGGRGRKKQVAATSNALEAEVTASESSQEKPGARRRGKGRVSAAEESEKQSQESEADQVKAEPEVKKPVAKRGRKSKVKGNDSETTEVGGAASVIAAPGDYEETQGYEDEAGPSEGIKTGQSQATSTDVKEEPSSPRSSRRGQAQPKSTSKEAKVESETRPGRRRGRQSNVAEVAVKEEEEVSERVSARQPRLSAGQNKKDEEKASPANSSGRGKGARSKKGTEVPPPMPAPAARSTRGKVKENKPVPDEDNVSITSSQGSARSSRKSGAKSSEMDSSQESESGSKRGRRSAQKEEPETGSSTRNKRAPKTTKEETPEPKVKLETPKRRGKTVVKSETAEEPEGSQTPQSRKQTSRRGAAAAETEEQTEVQPKGGRRKRPAAETAEGAKPTKQKKGAAAEPEPDDLPSDAPGTPTLRKRAVIRVPKVMFTGVIDEERMRIVKDLGGVSVDSIYDCTHLITDQVRRTVKFLCGVARGIYVVDVTWLNRCKEANTFIDAKPFVVKDPTNEGKFGFSLLKSLDAAHEKPMLQGYSVFATKGVKPPPDNIKDIVKCAGGEYLSSMPRKKAENIIIVSCEGDEKACSGAIKLGIPVVSKEFILTGILRQTIDTEIHQLFSSDGPKSTSGATEAASASKRKRW